MKRKTVETKNPRWWIYQANYRLILHNTLPFEAQEQALCLEALAVEHSAHVLPFPGLDLFHQNYSSNIERIELGITVEYQKRLYTNPKVIQGCII